MLIKPTSDQAVVALPGGENDEEILGRLRACLKLFEGSHPFHNYTKRRLYRLPAKPVRRASEAGSSLSTSAAAADAVNADEAETSSQPMQGASQQASGKPQKYEERSSTTTPGTGRVNLSCPDCDSDTEAALFVSVHDSAQRVDAAGTAIKWHAIPTDVTACSRRSGVWEWLSR